MVRADIPIVNVDPFELLGIRRDATEVEVNAAYRRLAPVFDPRRWNDDPRAPGLASDAQAWSDALTRAREAALDAALFRSAAMPGAPNRPGRRLVAVEGPLP